MERLHRFRGKKRPQRECRLLRRIRRILEEDTTDDSTCFRRVEALVCAYEACGIRVSGRHDF